VIQATSGEELVDTLLVAEVVAHRSFDPGSKREKLVHRGWHTLVFFLVVELFVVALIPVASTIGIILPKLLSIVASSSWNFGIPSLHDNLPLAATVSATFYLVSFMVFYFVMPFAMVVLANKVEKMIFEGWKDAVDNE